MTAANSSSDFPGISADGRFVVFRSFAEGLVPGQVEGNVSGDVFLYDRLATTVSLVSRVPASAVTSGNGESENPEISADGRLVAFRSEATDLVAGLADVNGAPDVFLYDRELQSMTLVSRAAVSPVTTGNGGSRDPMLSADGGFVAFRSEATDLVAGQVDGNAGSDFFLYDRQLGTTSLVSRAAGSPVTTGNVSLDGRLALSADGRFALFDSPATDLVAGQVDENGVEDLFLFDRVAGQITLVTRRLAGPGWTGRGLGSRRRQWPHGGRRVPR